MSHLVAPSPMLYVIAFLAASLAPAALAIFFWKAATLARSSWVIHLLFLPCAIGLELASMAVMFYAASDDGDGAPGLGLAILPLSALVLLTLFAYYITLMVKGAGHMRGAE